ncbi:hypothetical protein BS78_01G016300 [Paspalum vaginatum]|nr:hypothetical protein BS78_01G016300 [Paspalum vaginatum]
MGALSSPGSVAPFCCFSSDGVSSTAFSDGAAVRYGLHTLPTVGVVIDLLPLLEVFSGLLVQRYWYSVVPLLLLPRKREAVSCSFRRGCPGCSVLLTCLRHVALLVVASKLLMAFYGLSSSVEVVSAPVPSTQHGGGNRRRRTGLLNRAYECFDVIFSFFKSMYPACYMFE